MKWTSTSVVLAFLSCATGHGGPVLSNSRYQVELTRDAAVLVRTENAPAQRFEPRFTVLMTAGDPKLQMRWGEWGDPKETHSYNVLTWSVGVPAAKPAGKVESNQHVADGFSPEADQQRGAGQTSDLFRAAAAKVVRAERASVDGPQFTWSFAANPLFSLRASFELPEGNGEPLLAFEFTPKTNGWFSVGYTGAPEADPGAMDEMWQPLIWQEKRFPNLPFLTESARCTLPGTMVRMGGIVSGVIADPEQLPFMPMPTVANSRFGVAVRNAEGKAQSCLFVPILGGQGSRLQAGQSVKFKLRLVVNRGTITDTYASLAQGLYQFHDFRRNDAMGSLNRTLERIIDYGMSDWARYNDDLRGCSYDTDVPGSVKNVSALHPLGLALVCDEEVIYRRRALPMIEYLMSREKFLFTVNPEVKGQGASARLLGPCAPVSELTALYEMSGRRSRFLLDYARQLYGKTRTLNLEDSVRGDIWQNSLALYRATGEGAWLEKARAGADAYIQQRISTPQTSFRDPSGRGMFFWTSYAPNWMELFELYEVTGEKRYLVAAHEGARRFAQFTWMCPVVPDGEVLVNIGGRAPTYRNNPKLQPIFLPEERVPAWRVSELGLTCESSGTSKGHRGILLATHAPWMLRLASQTGDCFLHDIGRSAIVGRYTSFPGYHMNTARTTVYEKPDFAHRPASQLNFTSSLHYNHIWPHAALLLDYMIADAEARSAGAIKFPARFSEGYAYLQQRIYGDQPGSFYGDKEVWLWMPKGLLKFDEQEINYVAARRDNSLYLALMNQSPKTVSAVLSLDDSLVSPLDGAECSARVWRNNNPAKVEKIKPARFAVELSPRGITALSISGLKLSPRFQPRLAGQSAAWQKDFATFDFGGGHAMLINMGPDLKSAYVYLQSDGSTFKMVTLHYAVGSESKSMTDSAFPFEFTVPLSRDQQRFDFWVEGTDPVGKTSRSPDCALSQTAGE